ncbi:MAG: 2-phospho-L-lactate transferase [Acidimicrobiaceae bacterium]|nr:2-phospho-L-lactate transferase [Acidimicrobiaceae bacterium]
MTTSPHITVLCGGVGAARFLRALSTAIPPSHITAIVNTGDDTVLHGLHISPDLDTITYTLANAIDPDRGWGLIDESWRTLEALHRYGQVRPAGSRAGSTWFGLGDQDLATHFYRTARLQEGASLTDVTSEIASAWGLDFRLLPMTNDPAPTKVVVDTNDDPGAAGDGQISFQEYFVRHRHSIPVRELRLGASSAQPTREAIDALTTADAVVIAPSNPFVSIGPIRALPHVDQILAKRRTTVVAISPLVGGDAVKGPAADMMATFGFQSDSVGIAEIYRDVCSHLIIDSKDTSLAAEVELTGMTTTVTNTMMGDTQVDANLARLTLAAADIAS